MQVLSRVLSYAVDPLGKIAANPCEGIKQVYTADRSEIIWTDANILQLKSKCAIEISHAVDLAAHTGLRQGDLLRLSWSHIRENHIEITTGKSKHRRTAIIPLYDDLRAVLGRIPKVSTTILTNSHRRPWRGFGAAFDRAKKAADMGDIDLHFHDLRGTAVTKLYIANLPPRVIAEIVPGRKASRENHPPLCRARGCDQGSHRTDQCGSFRRTENINCKTASKTLRPKCG
ncbi:integrase [Bradyrhizobium sp. CIR3A]|nr:integrase [Bradyrhizobium sp. CIR3A]